jgi:UDP-glucuronate 4-epimerase
MSNNKPWLVTGAAGFLGYSLAARLLADGHPVVGVDDLSETYDPLLKKARLEQLLPDPRFTFAQLDVRDAPALTELVGATRPSVAVHLAARAGVRPSTLQPVEYADVNVVGTAAVLEACRAAGVGHVLYASSSSVYGGYDEPPFAVGRPADHPVSVYAATKRAGELLAHAYAHLHGLPSTGLRLFTAYGPWGRPDMAYFAFADAILSGRPITVYGDGSAPRDFTFADDVVEAIVRVAAVPPTGDAGQGGGLPLDVEHRPGRGPEWHAADVGGRGAPAGGHRSGVTPGGSPAPWRVVNVGNGQRVTVNELIARLEVLLGRAAVRVEAPAQPGDVPATEADTSDLLALTGFRPQVPLEQGLAEFAAWLVAYRAWR